MRRAFVLLSAGLALSTVRAGRQARRTVRESTAYYSKTDWFLGSVGVEYRF